MGMASTQVRLLQLTNRKNDIGFQLSKLSNDKMSLTRDMQKISKEYQNAINQKVLKWSNNSGVSYVNLSYKNLMRPGTMNLNKPYLLTDLSNKIVVDESYLKYAKMISPNGSSGGDWNSIRSEVLSSITGIDINKIENSEYYQNVIWSNESYINDIINNEPIKPENKSNVYNFVKNMDSKVPASFTSSSSWSGAYNSGGEINLGSSSSAASTLKTLTDNIAKTLGAYLDDPENLEKACETFYQSQLVVIENPTSEAGKASLENEQTPISGDSNSMTVNVKIMMDTIMASYGYLNGHVESNNYTKEPIYNWNNIDDETYQNWKVEHDNWKAIYDEAYTTYSSSLSENNQLFTADEEALINFYDVIFSSIAENGWSYNEQITDENYLNHLLQNNTYTITTVTRTPEFNENGDYFISNEYNTDIASNCVNIFSVNDSDIEEEALAERKYKESIINEKESRIDTRMENLKTEQSAVNQMLQSLASVGKDNIDRTFNWNA